MEYTKTLTDAEQAGLELALEKERERVDSSLDDSSTVSDYINLVVSRETEDNLRRAYEMQEHNALQERIDAMSVDEIAEAMEA